MLIDVRSEEEYNEGHHDGAVNIPLDQIPTHEFPDMCEKMTVYCASGGRARVAQMILAQRGCKSVELLNGTGAY